MPGTLALDFERSDLAVVLRDLHGEIAGECALHPGIGGVRIGQRRLERGSEALQIGGLAADDRAQRGALVVEIVARRDLLRDDRVVLRLRLIGVGDRRDADLEVALGLRQLLATAAFWLSVSSMLNCASRTSKYAPATRTMRSCCAASSVSSACSTCLSASDSATVFA